jgi:hypothetical protein
MDDARSCFTLSKIDARNERAPCKAGLRLAQLTHRRAYFEVCRWNHRMLDQQANSAAPFPLPGIASGLT